VLAGNAVLVWIIIGGHELCHLATARAAGAPARMSLGTRLQFLVAQTDVTGIWAESRRFRLTVYLYGITFNLLVASGCVWLKLLLSAGSIPYRLVGSAMVLTLLMVATQGLAFMRTDLYFVLQDLTRCTNLYTDAAAYLRFRARLLRRAITRQPADRPRDPRTNLPAHQRPLIRNYAVILVVGTIGCLAVALATTIPATILLLRHAVDNVAASESAGRLIDGLSVTAITGAFWTVWARTWWRRHRQRLHWPLRRREVTRDDH